MATATNEAHTALPVPSGSQCYKGAVDRDADAGVIQDSIADAAVELPEDHREDVGHDQGDRQ